jgi:hypothetical protein
VLGYNMSNEPVVGPLYILGLTQREIVMGINLYDYDKSYDNFIRVSKENNEQQSSDDICRKLFEVCKIPAKENNITSEVNGKNSAEISKKYLEQDDVNKIENKTTATTTITSDNVSNTSPEVKPNNLPPTEADNITQTETGKGDLQVYENSGFGIGLLYPAGWEKKEDLNTESVRFVSPREDKDDKYLQTINLFIYPSMSTKEATESLTNYYESSLKNYNANGSPRTSINANYSSVSMNYTYDDPTAGNIRSMDILLSPQSSNKSYLFTYRDEASKFEKDIPELQKIIDSIKFSK